MEAFLLSGREGIRTPDPLGVNQVLWTNWATRPIKSIFKNFYKHYSATILS